MPLTLPSAVVDLDDRWVDRDGDRLPLTPQEAALLRYLSARGGRAVDRDELAVAVLGYAPTVSTRAVDHALSRLRAKLERDPRHPVSLLSVRGKGYKLVLAGPAGEDPAELIGRRAERAAIDAALAAAGAAQLHGPPGAGKSALARATVTAAGGRVIDLTGARDVAEALTAIAHGIGARDAAPATLRVALGTAPLALDPLDALDPDAAPALRAALAAIPTVWVRRGPLAIDVPAIAVGGLEPNDARAVLVRAAQRNARGYTATDPAAHDRLADAVDRLPLALELCGARLPGLGPVAVLGRLDDWLRADRGDGRSLHAAIGGSWQLLSASTQRQLMWWSLFADAVPADLADAVSPDPAAVARAIAELQDAALLDTRADGLRPWVAVRAFAADALARSGEQEAAEAAFTDAWLAGCPADPGAADARAPATEGWAQRNAADLLRAAQVARAPAAAARLALTALTAAHRIDRRRADVLLAVATDAASRCDAGTDAEAALAAARLARYGPDAEGHLDRAAAKLAGLRRPDLDAQCHAARANLARHRGHTDAAEHQFRRALSASAGLPRRAAMVQHDLGALYVRDGRLEAAWDLKMQACAAFRRLGDRHLEAKAKNSLAAIARQRGDGPAAERLARDALALAEAVDAPDLLAECWSNLANILAQTGELAAAMAALTRAIALQRATGHVHSMVYALGSRGGLHDVLGDPVAAELDIREALALAREAGVALGAAYWGLRLAELAHRRGALADARRGYDTAIAELAAQRALPQLDLARCLRALLAAEDGDATLAAALLADAAGLLARADDDQLVHAIARGAVDARLHGADPDGAWRAAHLPDPSSRPLLASLRAVARRVARG